MHTIKRVTYDGVVSNFIGFDYQCQGGTGDAGSVGICSPGQIAADLSNGNVFDQGEKFMDTMHPIIKFIII